MEKLKIVDHGAPNISEALGLTEHQKSKADIIIHTAQTSFLHKTVRFSELLVAASEISKTLEEYTYLVLVAYRINLVSNL